MASFAVIGVKYEVFKSPSQTEPLRVFGVMPIEDQCKRALIDAREFLRGIDLWIGAKVEDGFVHWFDSSPSGYRIGIEYRRWKVWDATVAYAYRVRQWGKSHRRLEEAGHLKPVYFMLAPILDLIT